MKSIPILSTVPGALPLGICQARIATAPFAATRIAAWRRAGKPAWWLTRATAAQTGVA